MVASQEKILITGGTGSLGKALVEELLRRSTSTQITVFSRDELKQYEMQLELPNSPQVDYVIGDVRDRNRLDEVVPGHTQIIHTAALKQVVMGEKNPTEYIKTNILGTINVAEAAIDASVKSLVAISTDKASSPINLYGGTKFVADKYLVRTALNRHEIREKELRFSILRFGNFLNSRGSVLPVWAMQREKGLPLTITDPSMTRFWLTLEEGVQIVLNLAASANGSVLYVPRLRSIRISDLASSFSPRTPVEITGRRPGEKLHEELISEAELPGAVIEDSFFTINQDELHAHQRRSSSVTYDQIRSDSDQNLMHPDEIRQLLQSTKIPTA